MTFNKGTILAKIKAMDSKKILKEIKDEDSGSRVSVAFRIDKVLWDKFKETIGTTPQIKVLERLLREFIKGLEKEKK